MESLDRDESGFYVDSPIGGTLLVVGSSDYVVKFLSVVTVLLENGESGSRFPVLMNEMQGLKKQVPIERIDLLEKEIMQIEDEFDQTELTPIVREYLDLEPGMPVPSLRDHFHAATNGLKRQISSLRYIGSGSIGIASTDSLMRWNRRY